VATLLSFTTAPVIPSFDFWKNTLHPVAEPTTTTLSTRLSRVQSWRI
jgi:hypothetical protein